MGDSFVQEFLDYLRNREILSAAQFQRLERHRAEERRTLGQLLLEHSFLDEAAFLSHWAAMKSLRVLRAQDLDPSPEECRLVPRETCVQLGVLPLRSEKSCLTVASSDPTNVVAQDELRFLTGMEIAWAPAASDEIRAAIDRFYPPESSGAEDAPEEDFSPVAREIEKLFVEALESGATHVHLEPTQEAFILLHRLEGTLQEIRRFPPSLQAGITARLKILGELDIAERRLPQSGTIRFRKGDRKADFAIATLPTAFYRERITLSVLEVGRPVPSPEKLGLDPDQCGRLGQIVRGREGLVLVVGSGSSGRTTTLYSLAASISALGRKVISVEERVSRAMPEFTQVEPRAAASYPLSMAFRHALRQDAEAIVLDPLGDGECLQIVLRAATSGRLVLASLGARSLGSALERLLGMAGDPYLLGGAIRALLTQSLIRTLCPSCKEPEKISRDIASKYRLATASLFKPKGCAECHGVGFRGRTLVGHLQEVDPALRHWIQRSAMQPPTAREEDPFDAGGLRRAVLQSVENGTTSLLEALGHLES